MLALLFQLLELALIRNNSRYGCSFVAFVAVVPTCGGGNN
jgi:hypothetical protein